MTLSKIVSRQILLLAVCLRMVRGISEILTPRSCIGKVAENAKINSAIIPQWRAAKSHVCRISHSAQCYDLTIYFARWSLATAGTKPRLSQMSGQLRPRSEINRCPFLRRLRVPTVERTPMRQMYWSATSSTSFMGPTILG